MRIPPTPPKRTVRDLLMPPAPRDVTVVPEGPVEALSAREYELFRAVPDVQRVVSTGPGFAVMEDPYGNQFRVEGKRAWRNNNPGNIAAASGFAAAHGSIGKDDKGFAIFPNPKAGEQAMRELLFRPESPYANIDTDSLVKRYAPESHGNDVQRYQAFLRQQVQAGATPIKQMTPEQREALMTAIMRYEGYPKGGTVMMDKQQWPSRPMR